MLQLSFLPALLGHHPSVPVRDLTALLSWWSALSQVTQAPHWALSSPPAPSHGLPVPLGPPVFLAHLLTHLQSWLCPQAEDAICLPHIHSLLIQLQNLDFIWSVRVPPLQADVGPMVKSSWWCIKIRGSCGEDFSVQFSCSVVSDSLWPNGLQHIRLPCPSPTPRAYSNSCPSHRWCHPTISSSVLPFSSRFQSFPASGPFQMSQLFASGGQSIGVSASASVLPVNIQDWFPLGWIFFQSKGLSRVFSKTTVQKHQFFGAQLSL